MTYDKLTNKKKQLDSYRPLPDSLVHNLDNWFRIELTYTSNAIEGNTLTRHETALVVEKGLTVGGKTLLEHLEATNHAQALDWVKTQIKHKPQELTEKDILHIHNIILKGIDDLNAGCYRSIPVRISGSTVILPNPRKVTTLMEEFILWLKSSNELHPIELALEAHYQLVTIHPFVDGNGRTARLLMNMILLMMGYPPAIISKNDRLAYIISLEKAQLGGTKGDYKKLIMKAVNRSLDIYLKSVQGKNYNNIDEEAELLKIGELGEEAGVRNSAIRHWTKEGLLEIAEISDAGYHLYSPKMLKRIKQIQELQARRLTLQEIRTHLPLGG